jgi:integration host factor subunit alpha
VAKYVDKELPSLTKAQIAEEIHQRIGLSKKECLEIVHGFFTVLADSLEEGYAIRISGFGNFTLHDKGPRPGRNPRTLEEVPIEARRVVVFHAGQKLRKRVDGYAAKRK